MKVATYNVNGINGRLSRLLEWLAESRPDVVCLQEIKTTDAKCPAGVLEHAGYSSLWHGQRSHHGVSILARGERPAEIRRGFRLDFLMLTPDLIPRLVATGVDRGQRGKEKASDHAPVWIEI